MAHRPQGNISHLLNNFRTLTPAFVCTATFGLFGEFGRVFGSADRVAVFGKHDEMVSLQTTGYTPGHVGAADTRHQCRCVANADVVPVEEVIDGELPVALDGVLLNSANALEIASVRRDS